MSRTHYFYFRQSVPELEKVVKTHQADFDTLLEDSFSDEELQLHEKMLDSIAALYVQPILSELSFDDFYPDPALENEQRAFFKTCRSSICLENLPYFESNPLQVTYLIDLLKRVDQVLIDQGGVTELVFKDLYLGQLSKYRSLDSLLGIPVQRPVETKVSRPVDPIDFLILDVYKEIERLKSLQKAVDLPGEKLQKIYLAMSGERLDAAAIYRKSGLNPKDFDDNLERLKFTLRKI